MLSLVLPLSGSRSMAQVDAIPDPHQDFYQKQSLPRSSGMSRAPQAPPAAPDRASQLIPNRTTQASPDRTTQLAPNRMSQVTPDPTSQPSPDHAPQLAPTRIPQSPPNLAPASALGQAPQPGSNRTINWSPNTTSTAAPATPNDLTDVMGETAPVAPVDGLIRNTLPINTPVTHPELLPRPPIPTPPAVTLLTPMNGGQIKDPLAWRTRAYKLRSEGADMKTGLIKGSRLMNANFEDTLAALTTVCSSKGIIIDSIFESAGQVLAHPNDASAEKSRIIFSVKPVTRNSTLVRIGLDADNHIKQTSFDDLLNRIETSVNEKGVL
jgi:hypothetical protein